MGLASAQLLERVLSFWFISAYEAEQCSNRSHVSGLDHSQRDAGASQGSFRLANRNSPRRRQVINDVAGNLDIRIHISGPCSQGHVALTYLGAFTAY